MLAKQKVGSLYQRSDPMTNPECKPICRFSLLLLAAGWFLVAMFVGETELLAVLPGPAVPATVVGLTVLVLATYWQAAPFRAWVNGIDLRWLVALHLTRFVGIYFLVLKARGELSERFALTAGWGDIVVAIGAVVILGFLGVGSVMNRTLITGMRRAGLIIWNAVGLVDILVVVAVAASVVAVDRDSMEPMLRLPLSFLPTMLVPLIIVTHVLILLRLFQKRGKPEALSANAVLSSPEMV